MCAKLASCSLRSSASRMRRLEGPCRDRPQAWIGARAHTTRRIAQPGGASAGRPARARTAQIRYSALQVVDELFQRSHAFREQLAARFPDFMNLVLGLKGQSLPPPEDAAEMLQTLAWECIERWHRQFGPAYRQVRPP